MLNLNEKFSFDQEKAIETIVFFAQKAPIPDIYHLPKMDWGTGKPPFIPSLEAL